MEIRKSTLLLTIATTASLVGAFQPRAPLVLSRRNAALYVQTPKTKAKNSATEAARLMDTTENENDDNYIENPYYLDGSKPAGAPELAARNLMRQGPSILQQMFELAETKFLTPFGETPKAEKEKELRLPGCLRLHLSNEAVDEAERVREAELGGEVEVNVVSRGLYDFGCLMLDTLFDDRPIQRFWFLEVVARIPYFSYTSMLHLYESLGWWRAPELRKIHNAQEWNELHHLLIMESLGGNSQWSDRFLGYHAAVAYYWLLNAVFLFSPSAAYQFMELLESHAVDTYSTFLKENRDRLKVLPPPTIAKSYYTSADLYMFDEFQVSREPGSRRPPCENLYDVFVNICEDEGEHVKTMVACQDYTKVGTLVVSPHGTATVGGGIDGVKASDDEEQKRKKWMEWAESFRDVDLDARADDSGDFD